MTASTRALTRRLLTAGLTAVTLTTALPAVANAAPVSARAASVLNATAADASLATYEQKLAVAVKFGRGDDFALIERADRDFVIEIWKHVKDNPDFLELRVAAELAYSTMPDVSNPDATDQACYDFIVTGVFAAYDRDIERERREADAKRLSDQARAAAAASIDVVADAEMLNGADADFARLIWRRVENNADWPKVKAAASAALTGTPEQQRQFIATGLADAAKQDTDDRIAADESKTAAEKAAALARAAKQFAANRIGLSVTEQLLSLPDRDFVTEVWNHTDDGTEVQAAAIAAARSLDPAVWKAFIDSGIRQAVDRDIQIALDRKYQADKALAEQIKTAATASGDLNLVWWTNKALAGTPTQLADFLRVGQYDLDLTTGFESGSVQPSPAGTNTVLNVTGPAVAVRAEPGHTGTAALAYSGSDVNTLSSYAYVRALALSRITVKPTTTLSYWIYPQSTAARPEVKTRNSTCVAIDLTFSDGSNLRDSGLTDQRGNRAHPFYQCSKLVADRWNQVVVRLGTAKLDKQVTSVAVGYDQPGNAGGFRGRIDDIAITDEPVTVEPGLDPVDYPADPPRNDFNSDGNADVIARNADGQLKYYRGNGKGSWIDPSTSLQIGTGWNQFNLIFSPGDFNGDRMMDVIGRNAAGELRLYRGNGKGGWIDPSSNILIGSGWNQFTSVFSPGDFDGDGFSDVIARESDGGLRLYRGNGKGGWIGGPAFTTIGSGWNQFNLIFSPGDFNGDGFSDVIARNAAGELRLYRGNGKGGWIDPSSNILIGTGWDNFTSVFSVGDFNGDGFSDVIARNRDGELLLYRGNGKGRWIDGSTNIKIGTGWDAFTSVF